MKKTILLIGLSALAIVPLFVLAVSINENKAEQQAINAVPEIKKFEPKSTEWGKYFSRQHDSLYANQAE